MSSLDREEKKLLDSVENQEWQSIANLSEAVEKYQQSAKNYINRQSNELLPEHNLDHSQQLPNLLISITLDPDVAEVFKTSDLVNQILRVIMNQTLSVALEDTESETISLSLSPEFIEIIQKARVRQAKKGELA
jgi:hypothetical protein